ncbi:MAG: glutathione S-transferase [Pseudomonadota bacterium]
MANPAPKMLYDSPRAPNPRRVRMFLAEKGITLPTTDINIMDGSQFSAEYTQKIGTFRVPALELNDGQILTETTAICRYLEALHPTPNLLGETALEQAQMEMWSRRIEFELMLPIAFVLRHSNPAMAVMESPQCPEWAEVNLPKVHKAIAWLETVLQRTAFIAGGRFTMADITALVSVEFMRTIRTPIPDENTATLAWLEQMRARPGYVK